MLIDKNMKQLIGKEFCGITVLNVGPSGLVTYQDSRGNRQNRPDWYVARHFIGKMPEGTMDDAVAVLNVPEESFLAALAQRGTNNSVISPLPLLKMGLIPTRRSMEAFGKRMESLGFVKDKSCWVKNSEANTAEKVPEPSKKIFTSGELLAISSFLQKHIRNRSGRSVSVSNLYERWLDEGNPPLTLLEFIDVLSTRKKVVMRGSTAYLQGVSWKPLAAKDETEKQMDANEPQMSPDMAEIMHEVQARTQRDLTEVEIKYQRILSSLNDWKKAAQGQAIDRPRVLLGLKPKGEDERTALALLQETIESVLGENLGKA